MRGAGVDDVTLAHELTHALEDQHADLERLGERPGAGDDASTAQQALVEGSATLVMERYAARWPSDAPLGDALAGLTQVTGATPLPAYMARSLVFPYFQGERFVQALRDADGGGWGLVDLARARAAAGRRRRRSSSRTAGCAREQPQRVSLARRGGAGAAGRLAPRRRLDARRGGRRGAAVAVERAARGARADGRLARRALRAVAARAARRSPAARRRAGRATRRCWRCGWGRRRRRERSAPRSRRG